MRKNLALLSSESIKAPLILLLLFASFLTASYGCNSTREQVQEPQTGAAAPGETSVQTANDSQLIQAQDQHQSKVEVTITAPVQRILPADTRGNPHQKFLLAMSNGTTVLVAHNTKLAPQVPIQEGSVVTIHGEYIWNKKGGLLHYTHHSTNRRHESGWIQVNGQTYQ